MIEVEVTKQKRGWVVLPTSLAAPNPISRETKHRPATGTRTHVALTIHRPRRLFPRPNTMMMMARNVGVRRASGFLPVRADRGFFFFSWRPKNLA